MFDVGHLPAPVLSAIEADSFWCLSKLLDGIQDNYISQQPGIQRLVKRMGELVKRIDGEFHRHGTGLASLRTRIRLMRPLVHILITFTRSRLSALRVKLTHRHSTARGPLRGTGRRVPPVRVQVD